MCRPIGSINWFAVHCTSLSNTNRLISGDNKGVASQMMEKKYKVKSKNYVGAFAQSNEGDVSPNTEGAYCKHTGELNCL